MAQRSASMKSPFLWFVSVPCCDYVAFFFPLFTAAPSHAWCTDEQVVGAGGGLIGAAFNGLNTRVTKFRMAKLYSRRARLLGPVVIASTFALASFAFSVMVHDCKPRSSLPDTYVAVAAIKGLHETSPLPLMQCNRHTASYAGTHTRLHW